MIVCYLILKNYERTRAMNKNKFQILLTMSLVVGFEFGQASSYPISDFIRWMNPSSWGENLPQNESDIQLSEGYSHEGASGMILPAQEPGEILATIKKDFPHYIECFRLLKKDQDAFKVENGLYNFIKKQIDIEKKKSEDEDVIVSYLGDVFEAVEGKITGEMKPIFIAALQKHNPYFVEKLDVEAIHTMADLSPYGPLKNLENDKDPIVQYAMKYKDGWMNKVVDGWIREWMITTPIVDSRYDSLLSKVIAINNNFDVVKMLIVAGAKVDAKSVLNASSKGQFASIENSVKIMKLLLDNGGVAFVNSFELVPFFGKISPLNTAAFNINVPILNMLVKAGANVNGGQSSLYFATIFNQIDAAKALLEAGADKNITNSDTSMTPSVLVESRLFAIPDNPDYIAMKALFDQY